MFTPGAFLGQVQMAQSQSARRESTGTRWWMHHIHNTRKLGEAAVAGDMAGAVAAVGELWKAVLDWQKITGSPVAGVLMGEHTVLAKLLVDCFAKDQGGACTETALNALMGNVESHKALFPVDPEMFAHLFGVHTKLAGAYITDLADGRMNDFDAHFAEALANGRELAAFTDLVILMR